MRGKNLIKLIKTIDLLSKPQGVTLDELATELGIEKRSVYRVLETVQELGVPVYEDKAPFEKRKHWKIEESYIKKLPNMKIPTLDLTLSEIISLYMLQGNRGIYKGTDIEKRLTAVFTKIGMSLPKGMLEKLDRVKTLFIPSSKAAKDYSGNEETIESLTAAMLQGKRCKVKYHSFSSDTVKEFMISPLHFFENDGGIYIFARIDDFEDIRTLAVERIMELTVTDETFAYPESLALEEMLDSAFGIVYDDPIEAKIWFSEDQARYIKERKWAADQKIVEQEDGSVILEMKTSGWWDVKKWVLSFGAEAKVLEPTALRKELEKELKDMVKNYK